MIFPLYLNWNPGDEKRKSLLCELFMRIAADYPGDVGCWSVYFMNYVILEEGESMFLGPNVPHAYIYGGKKIHACLVICIFIHTAEICK